MEWLVVTLLFSALKNMFRNQPDLSLFTSQTEEREPNLSFHLANELWPYLFWLNCDFDVTKPNMGRRRPDIIFHRRGTHLFNALVVEVKREQNPVGVKGDLSKIQKYWFQAPLAYCFGASVLLNEKAQTFSVHLVSKNRGEECFTVSSEESLNYLSTPKQ